MNAINALLDQKVVLPTPGSFDAYVMIVTNSVPAGSIEFTVDIGSNRLV